MVFIKYESTSSETLSSIFAQSQVRRKFIIFISHPFAVHLQKQYKSLHTVSQSR